VSEINLLAEKFLREYMSNNASVEFHRVVCPAKRYEVQDAHETAEEFLKQVQDSTESERIEVSEPTSVIILRVCQRHLPAFLVGWEVDLDPFESFGIRFYTRARGEHFEGPGGTKHPELSITDPGNSAWKFVSGTRCTAKFRICGMSLERNNTHCL
jgi:hypothetical protein